MKFDEVHFENAKGHAVVLLKNAEKALEECNYVFAGWSLDDARSYLTTMRQETERDGAPDAASAKYEEIAARYNTANEKYEEAISEVEEKTEREKIEEAEEIAEMQEAKERLEALARFDAACDRVEDLLDEYAGELAENHSESYGTERTVFCKLASLLEESRELLSGDELNARWRRVERLKDRFHNLKRLGTIARRFLKVQEAFFN